MPDWKSIGGNVLLAAASLGLCVLAAEIALRAAGYEYSPLDIEVARNDQRVQHVFGDHHFVYDPDLIWRPKRNYSVFNDQGLRGPVLETPKPAGTYRVFTIGDSNTLGWAGKGGANWPEYMGELLTEVNDRSVVVNAGVWGYSSFQGLIQFRQMLDYEPDLVLISFGSNDAHLVYFSDAEFGYQRIRDARLDHFLVRSRLGQLALSLLNTRSSAASGELRHRVPLDDYKSNLTSIIELARARDVQIVLLTRPYMGVNLDPRGWMRFGSDYNTATAEVGASQGVPVVDVYSLFKDREQLFEDDSHFTEEGHRIAARLIFEHVLATSPD